MSDKTITTKICPGHRERETPLIFTFRFPPAEYWCPHCHAKAGMFDGFGVDVTTTPELTARAAEDRNANFDILSGAA